MAPESAIVAAGVGATFHLLRVVIDLVAVASETAKKNDHKIENSKNKDDTGGESVGRTHRLSLSTRNFNGRLSMRWNNSVHTRDSRRGSLLRRFSLTNRGNIPELQDPDAENQSEDDEEEEPKTGLEAVIPMISTIIHLTLFAYFLAATVLTSTSKEQPWINAVYDAVPLGCCTAAVFMGLLLNFRDYSRKRFSSFQRGLYSISALILLLGCIVLIAFEGNGSPTSVDIATLVCLSIYALLSITEGRVCRYPTVVATKEGKKAKLNKRALMVSCNAFVVVLCKCDKIGHSIYLLLLDYS